MRYTTYESFVKNLLSRGYRWDEVEYYWRNPEELENLEKEIYNSISDEEKAFNEYLGNIDSVK